MTDNEFINELKNIMLKFYSEVQNPLIKLVQEYKKDNSSKNYYTLSGNSVIKNLNSMALLTSYVIDSLDNLDAYVGSTTYKKTLTKKVRKALGYTY